MKKVLYFFALSAFLFSAVGCSNNMKRDVKRLSHKTTQCFSMIDASELLNPTDEFNECYSELEKLMEMYNEKYSDPEQAREFGHMYLEELQKSDLPQEIKDLYGFLYELGEED